MMIAVVAALLTFAVWSARHRTALVEDTIFADGQRATDSRWPDMRIDINAAGVAELALLPGVGDRLAQRIVDDRDSHGHFAQLDDLQRVTGMGAATIERLHPYAVASR